MLKIKKMKKLCVMFLTLGVFLSFNMGNYKVSADNADHYRISTHDLAVRISQEYDPKDSFDALIITKQDGTKERKNFEEFLEMGGLVETTVPEVLTLGTYETVYSINGIQESARILIVEDDVSVEYDLNNLDMMAHESVDVSNSFNSVTVTLNGETTTYHSIQEFTDAGGLIDDSQVPSPLKAGVYPIVYTIHGVSEIAMVNITSYRVTTHDFTLHASQTYDFKYSFDALIITSPDKSVERKSYDEFIDMGGTVETDVPVVQIPGTYETTFSIDGVQETGRVVIIEDEVSVDFDVRDVEQMAHDQFNVESTFNKVTVTINGKSTVYDTLDTFKAAGGIIDDSQIPSPLSAGTYDIEYTILESSMTATVRITEYRIETQEITIDSIQDYSEVDSFKKLIVITPDLKQQDYDYDDFVQMGGVGATSHVNDELYITTFELDGYETDTKVHVRALESYGVIFDFGYDNKTTSSVVESGHTVASPDVETRAGYIFIGWFTDKDTLVNPFDFNSTITSDLVLYAKWESIEKPIKPDESMNNNVTNNGDDVRNEQLPSTGMPSQNKQATILVIVGGLLLASSLLKKRGSYMDTKDE